MNKWEDSFKKTFTETNDTSCYCSSNQGLFIPNRQLSMVIALLLLLAFSFFMTGYFLGKKKAVEQFTHEVQQEAFADKVYTTVLSTPQESQSEVNALLVTHVDETNIVESPLMSHEEIVVQEDAHHYYAQLIGFGTEKAAQLFVKKLAAKGIETEVKKRTSKTAKGNLSYWYQVITSNYANKDDLIALVERLSKEENIKDACIRVC